MSEIDRDDLNRFLEAQAEVSSVLNHFFQGRADKATLDFVEHHP
jgi:hypothetical protein